MFNPTRRLESLPLAGRSSRFYRPRLEALEDRLLLAGMTWYWGGNGVSNAASEAANWTTGRVGEPQQVPGNGDIVIADGVPRVNGSLPNKPIFFDAAFTSTLSELRILFTYGSDVIVGSNLQIKSITQQTSSLVVHPTKTLTVEQFTESGGRLAGLGALSIIAGTTGSGHLWFNAANTHTIKTITINNNAQMVFNAPLEFESTDLVNNGNTLWGAGDILLTAGGTFTNNGGFDIHANNARFRSLAGGPFMNNGQVVKSQGLGFAKFGTGFQQSSSGSMNVQAGTLEFAEVSSYAGVIQIQPNAVVQYSRATHAWQNGLQISGGGTLETYGDITIAAGVSIATATPLSLVTGSIGGGGSLTTLGPVDWTGSTIDALAEWASVGPVHLHGNDDKLVIGTTIVTTGLTTFEGAGEFQLNNSSYINGGHFEIRTDALITDVGANNIPSNFTNLGTPTGRGLVTVGQGVTANIDVQFQTEGDFLLVDQDANFRRGFTQAGTTAVTNFGSGTITLYVGLNPTGTITVFDGKITGLGTINGNLLMRGGTLELGATTEPESLIINGDAIFQDGSTLKTKIAGASDYGALGVSGSLSFGGHYSFELLNGYTPPATQQFEIIEVLGTVDEAPFTSDPNWTVDLAVGTMDESIIYAMLG